MSDFRKRIRKAIQNKPPSERKYNPQSLQLSGLNILQVLEEHAPKYLQDYLHYGPESFTGENWAANLIWYRPKGYTNYQELTLFGLWAIGEGEASKLIIARKKLAFTAPVFNAESYNAVMKTSFKAYYSNDASPPPEDDIVFQTQYEDARRLALRREIADAIIQALRHRL